MPEISVIIPSYNHGCYLDQRISSVLEQTFNDIEVIILDDASTDGSPDVIKQWALTDSRISFSFNNHNSGSPFRQWAMGVEKSSGRYVWIAESDDFASTYFLEKMKSLLDENAGAAYAYCDSHLVDENDSQCGDTSSWKQVVNDTRWRQRYYSDGKEEIAEALCRYCTVSNTSGALFRASFLKSVKLDKIEFKYRGDWNVYIQLAKLAGVCFTPERLNYYRIKSGNASNLVEGGGDSYFESVRNRVFASKAAQLSRTQAARVIDSNAVELKATLSKVNLISRFVIVVKSCLISWGITLRSLWVILKYLR